MHNLNKAKRRLRPSSTNKGGAVEQSRQLDIAAQADAAEGIRQGLEDAKKRPDASRAGSAGRVPPQAWHTSLG
jgi:hypothetical protein